MPDSVKALRPEIPWHQVRAIGNILRHEYHGLSARILWNVVVDELPRLRIAVEALQAQAGDLPSDPVDTI
ncbi:HepT-like ribonuclease domain-containing protein [Methylorubrum extorquens]